MGVRLCLDAMMLYRFKTRAAGDVLMLGPHGDALLRAIGREPAGRGIIEPAAMPAALEALRMAIEADDAQRAACGRPGLEPAGVEGAGEGAQGAASAEGVSLRRRLWPMVEMLRRAHAADEPVVWGV
ncbi:MAG: hypothetical protein RI988_206 [Pseudomonadota bacterium]|jgi:hypothetical protein